MKGQARARRPKSPRQQWKEFKRAMWIGVVGFGVVLWLIGAACDAITGGDKADEYVVPVDTVTAVPAVPAPSSYATTWTAPARPTKTRATKTKRPAPTKTRTKTARPRPKPPTLPSVRPGAYCSPAGAQGLYNGRIYACKGPSPNRWRR